MGQINETPETVPQKKTKLEELMEASKKTEFRSTENNIDDPAAYIDLDSGSLELTSASLNRTDALRLRDFITEWFE